MPKGIYKRTEFHKDCFSFSGRHHSGETKKLLSKLNKGRKNPNHGDGSIVPKGERSKFWKGDKAAYSTIHIIIKKQYGQPQVCDFCGIDKAPIQHKDKRKIDWFNWAMKHETYSRNINDWYRLCKPCHIKYDNIKNYDPIRSVTISR